MGQVASNPYYEPRIHWRREPWDSPLCRFRPPHWRQWTTTLERRLVTCVSCNVMLKVAG